MKMVDAELYCALVEQADHVKARYRLDFRLKLHATGSVSMLVDGALTPMTIAEARSFLCGVEWATKQAATT